MLSLYKQQTSFPTVSNYFDSLLDTILNTSDLTTANQNSSFSYSKILDLPKDDFQVVKTNISNYGYRLVVRNKKDNSLITSWSVSSNYNYSVNYVNGVLLVRFDRVPRKELEENVEVNFS